MPCQQIGVQHDLKLCMYYHNPKDRRRPPKCYRYVSETCKEMDLKSICLVSNDCRFSHNKVEELYHPDKYKKKFCSFYPTNILNCPYGVLCSFAHSDRDI